MNDNTPLHYAASNGHLTIVKFLIEDLMCDPNCLTSTKKAPLHLACEKGHIDVVNFLVVTHDCDAQCKDQNEMTPLHFAATGGHLDVVMCLTITHVCSHLVRTASADTPLHHAARYGHLEVTKFFVDDLKCDPNVMNKSRITPLHFACKNGHLEVVKYFVEVHHCDPQFQDKYIKRTPLHLAAASGKVEIVKYFVFHQCNPSVRNIRGDTPLHRAAKEGHLQVVKFFIKDRGCDPNIGGFWGWKPLHYAIRYGHHLVSKFLIDLQDCDVKAIVSYGLSDTNPLRLAAEMGYLQVVEYLAITRRLDPYLQPDRQKLLRATKNVAILNFFKFYTDPLHYAAITGSMKEVRIYVEKKGWSPNILGRYGNNTLHNAAQYGQLEVVKYLTGLNLNSAEVVCDPLLKNKRGLTAQEIASRSGNQHVASYLLRLTTDVPVFTRHVISPCINLFVVGNSGSGKSTLVKALCAENSLLGRIKKVTGVAPLTAGIVPTALHSEEFGKVNILDFAGHEEYYASHEMIFQQATHPVVLIVVDISLSPFEIEKQILYWLYLLSTNGLKSVHLMCIGSHVDQITAGQRREIHSTMTRLLSKESTLKCSGIFFCDCRYSVSNSFSQFRQKLITTCRAIRFFITHHESGYSNRLCASLMHYLQNSESEHVTISAGKLCKKIKRLDSPGPTLVRLRKLDLLVETCRNLCFNGHLLFLPHDKNTAKSLLILNQNIVLSQIHACLKKIKNLLKNDIGLLDGIQLNYIVSKSLGNLMESELAIKYLIFTQFCTKITSDQLTSVPGDTKEVVHYFFPNLVLSSRPNDLWCSDNKYTHLYTWCLKCTNSRQFFTPRFLHTLFIQLIKCDYLADNGKYVVWKNGILFVHSNGSKAMVEVTDQTTRVYLVMQCLRDSESYLVKLRSMLISLIMSLCKKTCPDVNRAEFMLLPQNTYPPDILTEIPITDVAHSVLNGFPAVAYECDCTTTAPQHVLIKDLLFFDSFHVIEGRTLQEIINNAQLKQIVPYSIRSSIYMAVKTDCTELAKILQDESGMSFKQLHEELTQYSIIAFGSLCKVRFCMQ